VTTHDVYSLPPGLPVPEDDGGRIIVIPNSRIY
jgi:hypothetical protein